MKTIIAGSRAITDYRAVKRAIRDSCYTVAEVVSGGASGVDILGEKWARAHSIPVKRFPADWELHGKSAGPIRNKEMANYADALIAIWDGKSRGTANMIQLARKSNLPIFVYHPVGV